jgi:hypothetical protein
MTRTAFAFAACLTAAACVPHSDAPQARDGDRSTGATGPSITISGDASVGVRRRW